MHPEDVLHALAQEGLRDGTLPRRQADRTWGGPGIGAACKLCERPVTKNELEFEIQFVPDGDPSGIDKYHVHIRCFAVWELERRRNAS